MYAAAPSFFRHAMRAFGQPPPEEALPLLTCANSPEAAAAGQAGLGGGLGVARRVLRLIVSKRWLDVDAIVGRDPHLLLALLVVLGTGIYLLQRLFIKSFLRVHHSRAGSRTGFGGGSGAGSTRFSSILPEAEEQRVGEKCVRVFLHRCFLVFCIVASNTHGQPQLQHPRAHYAFFREWVFYLFAAACSFLLRRTLLLSEAALEHAGERPSIATVLLWMGANEIMVMTFIYRQLAAFPPPGFVSTLYPLAIYDAMQLLFEAGQVALKYAGLREEEEEEDEEGWEDGEQVAAAPGAATAAPKAAGKGARKKGGMRQRVRARVGDWGWDAAAIQQHLSFYFSLSGACVAVVQHLHVWALKGFGGDQGGGASLTDFVFFFMLQRCLWRLLFVLRSFLVSLSIARLIDRRFPAATEEDLKRRGGPNGVDVCSICLKPLKARSNVKRLPCHHFLHASCLLQCLAHGAGNGSGMGEGGAAGIRYGSSAAKCPLCRRGLLLAATAGGPREWQGPAGAASGQAREPARPADDGAAAAPGGGAAAVPNAVAAAPRGRPAAAAAAVAAAAVAAEEVEEQEERALLRLSTDDLLPSWLPLPLPSFSLEVVRRRPARGRWRRQVEERPAGRQQQAAGGGESVEEQEEDEIVQIPPQQQ